MIGAVNVRPDRHAQHSDERAGRGLAELKPRGVDPVSSVASAIRSISGAEEEAEGPAAGLS